MAVGVAVRGAGRDDTRVPVDKLTEQRKFVLWWDEQEKHSGNRGV